MNIGIDIGTSNTIVAYESEGEIHYLEYCDSNDLSGKRPAYVLPSEVFIPDLEDEDYALCVGGIAEKSFLSRDGKIVTSPKSNIGTNTKIYDESNESYTSIEVIEKLISKIYMRLTEVFPNETQFNATVTIPVTFNTNEIMEMLKAVQQMYKENGVGIRLSDIKTVHEPVAAYVACKDYVEMGLSAAQSIMVIDMGGGTLDISEVQRSYSIYDGKEKVDAKRLGGNRRLGGDDFDNVLADLITERINIKRLNDHVEMVKDYRDKVRIYSRYLKEKLQYKRDETKGEDVKLDFFFNGSNESIMISRKDYYEKASELIRQVKEEVDNAIKRSGKTYDKVLVVGGMSAEPFLQEYVYEKFGKENTIILNPSDENFYGIVAKGAAIINGNTDFVVINRALYSIGIKEENGTIDTIFEADTELNNLEIIKEYRPAKKNIVGVKFSLVEYDKTKEIIGELAEIMIDGLSGESLEDQTIMVRFRINEERYIEVNAYAKADYKKRYECKIVF